MSLLVHGTHTRVGSKKQHKRSRKRGRLPFARGFNPTHWYLFAGWEKDTADELDDRILNIRRTAGTGVHFSVDEWALVQRMRRRLGQLSRIAV
jgi:hypothetical protein